jgi:hypothetical protein
MQIVDLSNANSATITVTATATNLFDLIETAGTPDTLLTDKNTLDYVAFVNEDSSSSFRVLFDGNTPTSALGILIGPGQARDFYQNISKAKLIRTGASDLSVSVQLGFSNLQQ